MGTLTTKITENFAGADGYDKTTTTLTLSGIDLVDKRIMMATTTERPLASFGSIAQGGGYIANDVRYLRITNQDDTNFIWLTFKNTPAEERFALKLDAGQSFYLNGDLATGLKDFFVANSGSVNLGAARDVAEIRVLADTADCQIELYVASVA
jgi:hypothetical protein